MNSCTLFCLGAFLLDKRLTDTWEKILKSFGMLAKLLHNNIHNPSPVKKKGWLSQNWLKGGGGGGQEEAETSFEMECVIFLFLILQ